MPAEYHRQLVTDHQAALQELRRRSPGRPAGRRPRRGRVLVARLGLVMIRTGERLAGPAAAPAPGSLRPVR